MNFGQAIDSALIKKYKTFKGRACRAEWFYFLLFTFLLTFLVSIVGSFWSISNVDFEILATMTEEEVAAFLMEGERFKAIQWFVIGISVLLFVPSISVTIRRLQDLDISFMWVIPYFISSILALIAGYDPTSELSQRFGGVSNLTLIVYILIFLRKGTPGQNRFGENPLEEIQKDTY
jgi:uncharacterized membrane protein YhaH (DUF805 family)|tara:strand:- start:357 stop:887 length:531 start_codon:yes stop_codon:yes gene_type:complete